jgi:hypothetical protein
VGAETCATWPDAPLTAGCSAPPPPPAGTWDDLRLAGLRLIFLIVARAVSLLGLSRREWWWKDAEILISGDAADRHSWHDLALAARHRPLGPSRWRDGRVTGHSAARRRAMGPARWSARVLAETPADGRSWSLVTRLWGKPQPPVMSDRGAAEARYTCPAATGPAPPHGSASAATLATPDYSARYASNPEQGAHIKIPAIPHNPGKLRRGKDGGQGRGRTADLPLFRSTALSAMRTGELATVEYATLPVPRSAG